MRHAFPPEPRKAKLPSQVAGFLPGSLEMLSNPCLPSQAAARLDLPPSSRSCESHAPIPPCWGRTRVGEHPATPGTGRPAQGPGAQGRRPPTPTCLPSCPRGGGTPSTGWPGSKKQSGRKQGGRAGGKALAGLPPQTLLEAGAPPGLFTVQRSKQARRAGNGAVGGGGGPGKSAPLGNTTGLGGWGASSLVGGLRLHSPPPGLGKGHPQGTRGDGRPGGRLPRAQPGRQGRPGSQGWTA